MFRWLLGLLPAWVWALLVALAIATTSGIAWRAGARGVQARWDAAELRRQQAAADAERENRNMARAAEREFEAWRADRYRRRMEVARAIKQSLPPELAAVLVPAATVDQLRRAGADDAAAGSAAAGARR